MQYSFIKILLLTTGFLLSLYGYSQSGILISIEVDTHQITIGDQTSLVYKVQQSNSDDAFQVNAPLLEQNLTEKIEILYATFDTTEEKGKEQTLEYKLTITSFEEGNHLIPALPFVIKNNDIVDTLYSKESYLEVFGVAVDTTNTIRDIKTVERAPVTVQEVLPWTFLGIFVAALVYALIYLLVNRKTESNIDIKEKKLKEPPYVIALRELDLLKAQKLWQQKQVKEYYTRLTNIIRKYIELHSGIPALEQTTNEILKAINLSEYREHINYDELEELLNLSDMVKFAKGDPEPDENIKLLDSAYKIVNNTKDVQLLHSESESDSIVAQESKRHFYKNVKNAGKYSEEEIIEILGNGGRIVQFGFAVSMVFFTYSQNTKAFIIKQNESATKYSLPYTIVTLIFGWWGIPWGPIRTIRALSINFKGGKKVS